VWRVENRSESNGSSQTREQTSRDLRRTGPALAVRLTGAKRHDSKEALPLVDAIPPLQGERLGPMEFVPLKGGLTIPVPALRLALDLEERGIPLATDTDHQFIVPDDPRLTSADRAAIQRWKLHLGAIVEHQAPELPA